MKVTFVCSGVNFTSFSEFIPLSKYLNTNNVETSFLIDNNATQKVLESLKKENRNFYCEVQKKATVKSSNTKEVTQAPSKLSFIKNAFPFKILKHYFSGVRSYLAALKNFKHYEVTSCNFLSNEKPDCLILYGDRNLSIVPPSIKYARENNIPIIVLQVAASMRSILLHGRRLSIENSHSLLINKILKKKFPNQWTADREKSYSFYSWHLTLALSKLNMLPKNPWYDGDSWADRHLLVSKQNLIAKKKDGSLCENASIVGQYSHDLLHKKYVDREKTQVEMNNKYFNGNGKPAIIFAFPQFWEHNLMKKEDSFKEIALIVDALSKISNFNVLVSLHPKMSYEDYKIFELSSPNLKIAKDERLSDILPSGSIFLSTFESTISWALLCKVVPVYLDFYDYGFSLKNTPGCVSLSDKNNLETELLEITNNLTNYENKLASHENETLPPFDGKSGERILNEIKALVK
jgi:hypothetical protein|tara:strand:+ start:2551 stop:3939 length:1389 start_codon:yes stop_codon:yes gene_type:complete